MKWSKSLTKIDLMRFVSVIFNLGVVPSKLPNTLPNSLANFVLFSKKSWKRWSMIRFWHSEVYNNKFYLVPDSPRISKEWFRFWTRDSLIGKEIEISCTQPRISETCIYQHILFFFWFIVIWTGILKQHHTKPCSRQLDSELPTLKVVYSRTFNSEVVGYCIENTYRYRILQWLKQ